MAQNLSLNADRSPFCQLQNIDLRDDHFPPHFHIEVRGFRALVEIETMIVRAGDIRKAHEAMAWARQNVALLRLEWTRLNRRG